MEDRPLRRLAAEVETERREFAHLESPDATSTCLEWNGDEITLGALVGKGGLTPRRISAFVPANLSDVGGKSYLDRLLRFEECGRSPVLRRIVSARDAIGERGGHLRSVLTARGATKDRSGQQRCNVRETR